ncbi:metallophosphatase family protein [Alteribacter lacisalsi]|uniref:Phosphoesterase n=1 Tax=Alteribacter lacisalsi TaxID=2045244 RepID=A0A2W0H7A5_9BACI|nr:metallophosphatase family protein [Alteribacter lacisalsi]
MKVGVNHLKKIAAIYDIHGNNFALQAVLREIREENADVVVVGGDVVWGPQPREVMETLMQDRAGFFYIMGNADREVVHRHSTEDGCPDFVAEMNAWCADQLTKNQVNFLKQLPESKRLSVEGLGNILFIHGSPRSDEEAIRVQTEESKIEEMIKDTREDIIVCGHTHIQFDRSVAGKRIVNAGSVGLQSKANGACWPLSDESFF